MTDIFLRKEYFKNEPWYEQFLIFTAIGVCKPEEQHICAIQNALAQYGYETRLIRNENGEVYVVGK